MKDFGNKFILSRPMKALHKRWFGDAYNGSGVNPLSLPTPIISTPTAFNNGHGKHRNLSDYFIQARW
jgi:hypothetical protein